jgi:transposase
MQSILPRKEFESLYPHRSYQSDLTDKQWSILRPLLFLPEGGRPKTADLRSVVNAILYQTKTGCQWRLLPHDFLRKQVRVQEGRNEEPSLAIIDSQSVKVRLEVGCRQTF